MSKLLLTNLPSTAKTEHVLVVKAETALPKFHFHQDRALAILLDLWGVQNAYL